MGADAVSDVSWDTSLDSSRSISSHRLFDGKPFSKNTEFRETKTLCSEGS
ncbi:UNVERIFIED_CONTAM: hypothetical protein Slati_4212600 [Sesamum latifolium]|uniref:Uncharacterized protein n=1 Tax=Sesamum latifolium TaxID=2727402 RepID=A0AAW2TC10_9LAMI